MDIMLKMIGAAVLTVVLFSVPVIATASFILDWPAGVKFISIGLSVLELILVWGEILNKETTNKR